MKHTRKDIFYQQYYLMVYRCLLSQLIESLISKKIEELDLKDKVAKYDEPKKIVHKKKKKAKKKAKKLNGKA